MDDEAAEIEREYQEEKARERAEAERLVGVVLGGKYRVDAFVGGGAMGKVYRATQLLLDKTVAVKVLHAGLGQDEKFQARFHREAKAASKMDHPNSVGVVDFGIERDGTMFIVMEFLAGRDLFHALRNEWPFSNERIVEVMTQVLSALAVAHEQGIVHRDLKPENIMLVPKKQDDGTVADVVKVADFGIAKIMDSHRTGAAGERLSTAGNIAGTPEYMSPEQAQAANIDGRADLYSCGVILYEMCTGKLPFSAETPIGVVLKHITEQPAPPSTINPSLSHEMEAVIMKALAKSPADRFADARSMRAALRSTVGMRDMTTASLSASAMSAIAAIEAAESAGQASTIVGMTAPVPRSVTASTGAPPTTSAPTLTGSHSVATRAETTTGLEAPAQPRTPSGPKGDRTHSTNTSHEVPIVAPQAPAPAVAAPASGVSKATLVSSMVAALAIGALAVVTIGRQSNSGSAVNGESRSGAQAPAPTNSSGEADSGINAALPSPVPGVAPEAADAAAAPEPTAQPNVVAEPAQNSAPPERGARPSANTNTNAGAAQRNNGSANSGGSAAANGTANSATAQPANGTANSNTATTNSANAAATPTPVNTAQTQLTVQTPVVNVAHNPTPPQPTVAPLNGVRGSFSGLSASGGVLVNRLQGRAQTAADAVARCALSQARAQRTADSFTGNIDVTLNIAVAERRVDRVRLLGGPAWIAACGREAEPAFSGDLPEADDPEYTITLRVSLSPQR